MITKQPKLGFVQILKKNTKAILIFEGALFLGSYGIWYSMNTSQGKYAESITVCFAIIEVIGIYVS